MNWLDFKLGGRMLVKYPGLTVVGGLAMSFAIWVGIVIFQFVTLFLYPTLPLSAGDRLVEIRAWDTAANDREERVLHDFIVWRDALRSVTELGAWRDSNRNLIVEGDARPVHVAEMSASGFRVADGAPLLGRVIADADERPDAPPVAVIAYGVWQGRFGSDPNIVGRTLQLGNDHVPIVGVMREGFAFPVSHDVWLPLRTALLNQAPRAGPAISVFGVLAPGATLETAQAELTTIGHRAALELPNTHEHLEPRVSPYALMLWVGGSTQDVVLTFSIYFFVGLLLVLICCNVGLLLFARAATRESDLIVRTALGASRARIVGQLFAEALVLGSIAGVVGLAAADFGLRKWGLTFLETNLGRLPFWFDLSLSPSTVAVALALTVLAAGVAGVMPALKITRGMANRLKQTTAGAGGLKFGGVWSVVIVAQVAVTVVFPGLVYWEQFQLRRVSNFDLGFAAEQYLTMRIERDDPVDRQANADAVTLERNARLAATLYEVRERVAAQPGVAGVTFAERLPATAHPQSLIEMPNLELPFREATIAAVDPSYFDVLQAPILAGRGFTAADARPGSRVAIVDQGFVDQVLQGRNPVGQHVRFTSNDPARPNPWNEIVGLVRELGVGAPTRRGRAAGIYLPATPDLFDEGYMIVHARGGDPMALAADVRQIATTVDPALRLADFQRADRVSTGIMWVISVWLSLTVAMSAVALLLSLAGIYAVLSFIVSRRTREIGIRVALGASRPRVIATIFRRPLLQVGLGVLAGTSIIFTVATLAKSTEFPGSETGLSAQALVMLVTYAVVMMGVCLFACVAPTRRALSVEPTVALRMD